MHKLLVILFILCFSLTALAQPGDKFPANKQEQAKFEEADFLLSEGDYPKAFDLYKEMELNHPNNAILLFRMGVAKLNMEQGDEEALAFFNKADKEALAETDFAFYYAIALHKNYKFADAITQMESYLAKAQPGKAQKELAQKTIRHSKNGQELIQNPADVAITTLGDPLNTSGSEYAPIISADERTILFTYRGEKSVGGLQEIKGTDLKEYNEDVQISYRDSVGWLEPILLPSNSNTLGNDACVAISPDAQYVYIFRSIDNDPGSLYRSELDGMTWSNPELLKGEINSKAWEGSITISHDGRKVFFASERAGGNGMRDIYEARKMPDGSWGKIKNLGTNINTDLNDDAPFLHPSGKYLVFSSEGHNSMGGYDIFVSELGSDSVWGAPRNIGYPINSTSDDKFYTVTADGKHGYYSSGKKGGMGKQDIYLVEPGIDKNVVMVQVIGDVSLNDIPTFSEIEVYDDAEKPLKTIYNSNSKTGKFLIDLPPGKAYKIKFIIGGMEPKTFDVDARNITGFVEKYINVKFYEGQDPVIVENKTPKDSVKTPPVVDTTKVVTPVEKTMTVEELKDFNHPDLMYRVQIGAYRYPNNFRKEKFERDAKSDLELLNDGVTRFTIKKFKTLREAYAYRDEMIKLGVSDAFVTAIFKGKRYLLVDIRPLLYEVLKYEPK